MSDTQLIHVRVPADVVRALDEIDRERSRADKVTEALEDYVRKRRLLEAVVAGASSLSRDEREIWNCDEAVDAWVRERRGEYDRGEPS